MAKIDLAYVHRFCDRHGHLRHYFRRPGHPRVTLPGLPGTAEFMAAYRAAMNNAPLPTGGANTVPGSFGALVVAYYGSSEFRQLAPVTQATYRNRVERLRVEHGGKPVVGLHREHVRALMAAKLNTPQMGCSKSFGF